MLRNATLDKSNSSAIFHPPVRRSTRSTWVFPCRVNSSTRSGSSPTSGATAPAWRFLGVRDRSEDGADATIRDTPLPFLGFENFTNDGYKILSELKADSGPRHR